MAITNCDGNLNLKEQDLEEQSKLLGKAQNYNMTWVETVVIICNGAILNMYEKLGYEIKRKMVSREGEIIGLTR